MTAVLFMSWGLMRGERLRGSKLLGVLIAIGGLIALLLPGLAVPPPLAAILMLTAGIAWGAYSLLGRSAGDPTSATAGNFLRSVPIAATLMLTSIGTGSADRLGVLYAAFSGALTSGLGYVLWYAALPSLKATTAMGESLMILVMVPSLPLRSITFWPTA